ncbi:MAG: nicotinate (nicotinamide) nucleotide adenylyltransferase [Bacteroidales bacterium]|nr:nicotinate (nicotinamide) nucleotide adenylyltransferase [Bacteroidales bacterium]
MCFRIRRKRRDKVALLFGSFNPIHEGHLAILRYLLEKTDASEVRLVVSPQSPFKKGQGLVDNAGKRLADARETISDSGLAVTVSDVEFHLPEPWYTIDTLRFLQEQEPGKEFVLVMGGDNIATLERWRKGDEILRDFEVWVYPRPGTDAAPIVSRLNSGGACKGVTLFAEAPQNPISSTEIRKRIGENK